MDVEDSAPSRFTAGVRAMLTPPAKAQLEREASRLGVPVSALVRMILNEWLETGGRVGTTNRSQGGDQAAGDSR